MALRDLLFDSDTVATATPATHETEGSVTVASVATVAVAKTENSKTSKAVSIPKTIVDPDGPCPACGSGQWWQLPGRAWRCRACEPDMPLTTTTLTLPCHKVELRPAAALAELRTPFETACQGLNITPQQLHQQLEENGDLPDLVSGALTPTALRLTAETLGTMQYAGDA
jgi:hypothetical protein